MTTTIGRFRDYIQSAGLPAAPPAMLGVDEATQPVFDAAKNQAVVVGSDVISFVNGIDAETRSAISDCSLFAQLVAKKKVPDRSRIYEWFDAYFEALTNIGWAIQERGNVEYAEEGEGFEVHEAILKFRGSARFGPGRARTRHGGDQLAPVDEQGFALDHDLQPGKPARESREIPGHPGAQGRERRTVGRAHDLQHGSQ